MMVETRFRRLAAIVDAGADYVLAARTKVSRHTTKDKTHGRRTTREYFCRDKRPSAQCQRIRKHEKHVLSVPLRND